MPLPKQTDDAVQVRIPRTFYNAVIGVLVASMVPFGIALFSVFGRMNSLEQSQSKQMTIEEKTLLLYKIDLLMKKTEVTEQTNKRVIDWIESQENKKKRNDE